LIVTLMSGPAVVTTKSLPFGTTRDPLLGIPIESRAGAVNATLIPGGFVPGALGAAARYPHTCGVYGPAAFAAASTTEPAGKDNPTAAACIVLGYVPGVPDVVSTVEPLTFIQKSTDHPNGTCWSLPTAVGTNTFPAGTTSGAPARMATTSLGCGPYSIRRTGDVVLCDIERNRTAASATPATSDRGWMVMLRDMRSSLWMAVLASER
jgi:hypothetical protein